MHAWHFWILVAILFFIIEIFTPGFVLACFGVGCIASALAAFLKFNFQIQILAFSITTLAVFFGLRPLILQYFFKSTDNVKTNVEALTTKIGRVSIQINPVQNTGRVIINGEDWRAISIDESIIDVGEKVEVLKVDGAKVIIKKLAKSVEEK
ncbi:NfeD family protein [candidate division KSB1 bacterium]|nr:NfeD family protein [candidate division KSB1 bacterium]